MGTGEIQTGLLGLGGGDDRGGKQRESQRARNRPSDPRTPHDGPLRRPPAFSLRGGLKTYTSQVPYRAVIQEWHDFYIVAGTIAATLVGLLFVGLSLHLRIVLSRDEVRSLARVTLANLGLVLLVSMFMVIPQSRSSLRNELLFSGIVTLSMVVPSVRAAVRSETRTLSGRVILRLGLSAAAYIGVVISSSFYSASSYRSALSALVAVIVALVVISLRSSWDLLVRVGEVALDEKSDEP